MEIKDFLKSLPQNTKISFQSFLDNSYYVGGIPQINRVIVINVNNNIYEFKQSRDGQKWDFLPKDINIWKFRNYIIKKADDFGLCKIECDYYRGLRFYEFYNLPLKIFL